MDPVIRWLGEFGESHRKPMSQLDIHAEFVVAAAEVLHERVPGTDHAAERSRFSPRIARSRALNRP